MRRHDARKWLHAILDLLPVILIPVFMIYSHRHQINDYTETIEVQKVVDFNQKANGDYVLGASGSTFTEISEHYYDITLSQVAYPFIYFNNLNFDDHTYLFKFYVNSPKQIDFTIRGDNVSTQLMFSTNTNDVWYYFKSNGLTFYSAIRGTYPGTPSSSFNYYFGYSQVFDLTQMDLEDITIDEFKNIFNENYYSYTLSETKLITIGTETLSETYIGAQFMYNFNNTVNKYFNMGNVFGLNGVYEWFNTNIFGGNAPTIIYSVWNIALYELLMDLLMLLYALFMWFIDFCQDLIDRCFTTSKGGKH